MTIKWSLANLCFLRTVRFQSLSISTFAMKGTPFGTFGKASGDYWTTFIGSYCLSRHSLIQYSDKSAILQLPKNHYFVAAPYIQLSKNEHIGSM
jgi:hypothetical protein